MYPKMDSSYTTGQSSWFKTKADTDRKGLFSQIWPETIYCSTTDTNVMFKMGNQYFMMHSVE